MQFGSFWNPAISIVLMLTKQHREEDDQVICFNNGGGKTEVGGAFKLKAKRLLSLSVKLFAAAA